MDFGYQCPVCTAIYRSYDQVMDHIRTHMESGSVSAVAPVDSAAIVNRDDYAHNNGDDYARGISNDQSTEYPASGSLDASLTPGSKTDKKSKQRTKQQQHKSSRSLSPSAAADLEGEPADGQGKANAFLFISARYEDEYCVHKEYF